MSIEKLGKPGVLFGLCFLLVIPLGAATLTDEFEESWDVNPGGDLVLSNENGSIEIESWDRDQVHVQARVRVKAGSRNIAEDALKDFRIVSSRDGDTIRITTKKPPGNDGLFSWLAGRNVELDVHYEVRVPSRFDLNVETVNGSIDAKSISGISKFETVNGRIVIRNAAGSVSAGTVNGSIDVELSTTARGDRMAFSTTNGGISLALPQSIAADLDAATTNGKITSDIPVTSHSFTRSRVRGTLNGGGVPIKVRTVNGSIRISAS